MSNGVNEGKAAFKKDNIYTSERDGCLTDEFKIVEHYVSSDWEKFFEKLEPTQTDHDFSYPIINQSKRVFDTGAKRDTNSGKPFVHCLMGYTRQRFGYHMAKNANKYGVFNFLKGIPTEVYLESLDRHLAAYIAGDRTEDHLSSILFGVQGCMLNEEKDAIPANHYFQ